MSKLGLAKAVEALETKDTTLADEQSKEASPQDGAAAAATHLWKSMWNPWLTGAFLEPSEEQFTSKPDVCEALIRDLEEVVRSWPARTRPSFWYNKDHSVLRFAYEGVVGAEAAAEHRAAPDIVMSFPGEPRHALLSPSGTPSWHDIALVFQVFLDPAEFGDEPADAVGKCAMNMHAAHFASDVFVLTAHNRGLLRLWHSRLGARPIRRLHTWHDYPRTWDFFARLWFDDFCRPPAGDGERVRGHSPMIRRASVEDVLWAEGVLRKGGKPPMSDEDRRGCRWNTTPVHDSVEVVREDGDGAEHPAPESYLIVRTVSMEASLEELSMVWEIILKGDSSGDTQMLRALV